MASINDDKSFKLALITEDLQGDQSKDGFVAVCEQARAAMSAHDIGSDLPITISILSSLCLPKAKEADLGGNEKTGL